MLISSQEDQTHKIRTSFIFLLGISLLEPLPALPVWTGCNLSPPPSYCPGTASGHSLFLSCTHLLLAESQVFLFFNLLPCWGMEECAFSLNFLKNTIFFNSLLFIFEKKLSLEKNCKNFTVNTHILNISQHLLFLCLFSFSLFCLSSSLLIKSLCEPFQIYRHNFTL